MGLAEDVLGELPFLREQAESLMTEVADIGSLTYEQGPNLETIETISAPVYSGRCRLKWQQMRTTDTDVAGQMASESSVVLKLPIGTTGVHEGMMVLVSASTVDPSLPGRRFRIAGTPQSGQVTALRFPVSEESS